MTRKTEFLNAGEAARRLGVSAKALRIYEEHGLISPDRTRAGWRSYGPQQLRRATEIISMRKLGLGIAEIARLSDEKSGTRASVLDAHRSRLESQIRQLGATLRAVDQAMRTDDHRPPGPPVSPCCGMHADAAVSFELPWPWGGERFELDRIRPLSYVTGPLGSGKTRLAMCLADNLENGRFLGLDRFDCHGARHFARLEADQGIRLRCTQALRALSDGGATASTALTILTIALCSDGNGPLVIDMVEQGLDEATQKTLAAYLRRRERPARPLCLMTRSSAILDFAEADADETILYCPANHGPPLVVHPDPLCRGYEAVAMCLATPSVRARTAGLIASWTADAAPSAP